MKICRFCKVETDYLNKDGICPDCEKELGVTVDKEVGINWGCLFLLVILAGIMVGAVYGAYRLGDMLLTWLKETRITGNTEMSLVILTFLLFAFTLARVSLGGKNGK